MQEITRLLNRLDNRWRFIFYSSIPLSVIKSFFDVLSLGLIAPFLAAVVSPNQVFNNIYFQKFRDLIGIEVNSNVELIFFMSISLIAFFIIKGIFGLFVQHYTNYFIFHGRAVFNAKLMKKYLSANWEFHKTNNSSYLDRNLRVSSQKAFACLSFLLKAIIDFFFVVFAIALLAYVEGRLVFFASIFFIAVLFIWYKFSGPLLSRIGQESVNLQGESAKIIRENFDSIREIITFQSENHFSNKYFLKEKKLARIGAVQALFAFIPIVFIETIAISILAGSCVYLIYSDLPLMEYIPVLGLFGLVILRLLPILLNLIKSIQQITYEYPAMELINNQINYLDQSLGNRLSKLSPSENLSHFQKLELDNLSFSYGKRNILSNISLTINQGDSIGIIGPSGAGKSTLLNILLGLLEPSDGKIKVNDSLLTENIDAWRNLISFVPQEPVLFDGSIRENISFGSLNFSDDEIWAALKSVKLDSMILSQREGLDTEIGERGGNFSGGQKQRLSLARALIRSPQVIFLDEFTSALDTIIEKEILTDLFEIKGLTIILVSHSKDVIDYCQNYVDLGK